VRKGRKCHLPRAGGAGRGSFRGKGTCRETLVVLVRGPLAGSKLGIYLAPSNLSCGSLVCVFPRGGIIGSSLGDDPWGALVRSIEALGILKRDNLRWDNLRWDNLRWDNLRWDNLRWDNLR
jgi:hypothetical protein